MKDLTNHNKKKIFLSTALTLALASFWGQSGADIIGKNHPTTKVLATTENSQDLSLANDLIELVGPIALYPDDLLAIVLQAARHPVQIVAAARLTSQGSASDSVGRRDWEQSIAALLNYPIVFNMLNENIEWTEMLGQKFESDETSVLEAIQQFRQVASQKIDLDGNKRQSIAREADRIIIRTTNPAKIYVPLYDHRNFIDGSNLGAPFLRFHHIPYRSYYFPYRFSGRNTFYGLTDYFQLSWMDRRIVTFSHSDPGHPFFSRKYRKRHGEKTDELIAGSISETLAYKKLGGSSSSEQYRMSNDDPEINPIPRSKVRRHASPNRHNLPMISNQRPVDRRAISQSANKNRKGEVSEPSRQRPTP
jgi:hypothetical protein